MGRTMPSFRIALAMEWKKGIGSHFATLLANQIEKEVFDEMWDIPKSYISACSLIMYSM
jgi:hypothetical protein